MESALECVGADSEIGNVVNNITLHVGKIYHVTRLCQVDPTHISDTSIDVVATEATCAIGGCEPSPLALGAGGIVAAISEVPAFEDGTVCISYEISGNVHPVSLPQAGNHILGSEGVHRDVLVGDPVVGALL